MLLLAEVKQLIANRWEGIPSVFVLAHHLSAFAVFISNAREMLAVEETHTKKEKQRKKTSFLNNSTVSGCRHLGRAAKRDCGGGGRKV
jgi:hypothetical protein